MLELLGQKDFLGIVVCGAGQQDISNSIPSLNQDAILTLLCTSPLFQSHM